MKAHKENSSVFKDLSEDQKQRLRQLAIQILLKPNENNKIQNESIQKTTVADTKSPISGVVSTQATDKNRQTLIKNALVAHKKHSKALDSLSKKQKKKLRLLAMETMFGKTKK